MKRYLLDVTVEQLEDGRFLATAANLRGALAEGDTIAEAIENLEDGARSIIENNLARGWPLPEEFMAAGEAPVVEAKVVVTVTS
jgi:predicted RNase H-like HicB family nuclease